MIGISVTNVRVSASAVGRKLEQAERRAMYRGAAYVRTTAKRSLGRRRKDRQPSSPGTPPRSQTGRLRKGIVFAVDSRSRAVIGPAFSLLGPSGSAHEHGGRYRGEKYPARPFMRPAMERAAPRVAELWRASIR